MTDPTDKLPQPTDEGGGANSNADAPSRLRQFVDMVKDAKDVLTGIGVIAAALIYVLTHFATQDSFNCFKNESRRAQELLALNFQITSFASAWVSLRSELEEMEAKKRDPAWSPDLTFNKRLDAKRVQLEDAEAALKGARQRHYDVEHAVLEKCD